jgi:cell division protein YceG involved in septum cleavage
VLFRLETAALQAVSTGSLPHHSAEFLRMLAEGEVIRYRFTLVEGWTYRQVVDALYADPVLGEWLRET